jgi:hypothetical protein
VAYFGGGWDDHWVCEYWDRQAQRWHLSDPQIDQVLKARLRDRSGWTAVRASLIPIASVTVKPPACGL